MEEKNEVLEDFCQTVSGEAILPSPGKGGRTPGNLALWFEKKRKSRLPLVFSFLLPFLIFTFCLALLGVYPFGDRQILNYDGWHQYYPFVLKLWDHFHEGTSLLYDWSMGMGTNFLSMLSYYGSSPLNLLVLFAPERDFRVLFTFFVVLRIGLSGLFCGMLLKKIAKNPGWSISFFSLAYALCGYLMGYFWNMMWLDTVALFPLLCLSALELFREAKCSRYVLVMALSLFANYYIGYMSCVFIAISFFAFCFRDKVRFSDFVRRGFRLLSATLLGAGIAAVLLLPAFFGLMSTASTKDATPMYVSFYESIRDLIAPLASFHEPAVMDGLPNLSSAAIISLFAFSFLWAKKIGFRDKIIGFFYIVFLLVSMNFSVLNYIWHGFHYTNMIPYRFAFTFVLVLVIMAYLYYKKAVDAFDWIDALGMLFFSVLIAFCAYGYYETWSILATVAVFALAVVLCAFYTGKIFPRSALSFAVCTILLVETSVGAYLGTKAVGTTGYSDYFDLSTGEGVQELVDMTKEIEGENTFYRTEVTQWRSLNDSCFYNYNGISQFSSSANRDVSEFLLALGMPADPGSNRFVYVYSTPLANTLLGVKYVINKDGYLSDSTLKCISATSEERKPALYEDTSFSGLGFMVKGDAKEFSFDMSLRPYERQNAIFKALTGLEGDLFTTLTPTSESHTGLTAQDLGNGYYSYTAPALGEGENDSRVLHFTYEAPENGSVFIYADAPLANYVQVNGAWHCIEDYPNFFSAGYFMKGENVDVRTFIEEETREEFTGNVSYDVVMLNHALWEEGLALLQDESLSITHFEETLVQGEISVKEDGFLYTSIPFEKEGSWTVKVDGQEVEPTAFSKAFVGIELSKGEHVVEFSYSPLGFQKGAWISIVSILLLIALFLWEKKGGVLFPDRKRPDPVLPETSSEEEKNEDTEEIAPEGEEHDHSETDVSDPQGT